MQPYKATQILSDEETDTLSFQSCKKASRITYVVEFETKNVPVISPKFYRPRVVLKSSLKTASHGVLRNHLIRLEKTLESTNSMILVRLT